MVERYAMPAPISISIVDNEGRFAAIIIKELAGM
jgi:hypothetical protein